MKKLLKLGVTILGTGSYMALASAGELFSFLARMSIRLTDGVVGKIEKEKFESIL